MVQLELTDADIPVTRRGQAADILDLAIAMSAVLNYT